MVDYYGNADFVILLHDNGPWRRDHCARESCFPDCPAALFAQISPIHQL